MNRIEQVDVHVRPELVLHYRDPAFAQRMAKGQHELIASPVRRREELVPEADLESVAPPCRPEALDERRCGVPSGGGCRSAFNGLRRRGLRQEAPIQFLEQGTRRL